MIPRVESWHWQVRADCILLAAPEVERGVVRYIEQQRPLQRLGDLLARHTSWLEPLVDSNTRVERVVTNEGEYGALVLIDGSVAGAPVCAALGFVFADDSYALVEGVAAPRYGEAFATTVRDLVVADRHYLGARRRRYVYQGPPWPAVTMGSATAHFLSPGYPRDQTRISVYPAIPLQADETPLIDLQRRLGEDLVGFEAGPTAGFVMIAKQPAAGVATASGLHGTRYRLRGRWNDEPPIKRDIVLVRDARFAYTAELVADAAGDAAPAASSYFDELVRSIEPIPSPSTRLATSPRVAVFSHWAD